MVEHRQNRTQTKHTENGRIRPQTWSTSPQNWSEAPKLGRVRSRIVRARPKLYEIAQTWSKSLEICRNRPNKTPEIGRHRPNNGHVRQKLLEIAPEWLKLRQDSTKVGPDFRRGFFVRRRPHGAKVHIEACGQSCTVKLVKSPPNLCRISSTSQRTNVESMSA